MITIFDRWVKRKYDTLDDGQSVRHGCGNRLRTTDIHSTTTASDGSVLKTMSRHYNLTMTDNLLTKSAVDKKQFNSQAATQ